MSSVAPWIVAACSEGRKTEREVAERQRGHVAGDEIEMNVKDLSLSLLLSTVV